MLNNSQHKQAVKQNCHGNHICHLFIHPEWVGHLIYMAFAGVLGRTPHLNKFLT